MYKAIIAIGLVAAACLATGCGSSSDETAEAAVTKAQFIKRAQAVCSKVQKEGVEARTAWEKAHGEEMEFENSVRLILGPTMKQQAEQLRSLEVPEEDKAELARMINNLSEGAAAIVKEGGKSKSISKFEAFQREAEAYGLEGCRV